LEKLIGGLFKTYKEYLDSDLWREKSNLILSEYHYCYICKQNNSQIVHHKTYEHVCNEQKKDLIAICWSCHDNIHKKVNHVKKI
jgi:hypothetical protein